MDDYNRDDYMLGVAQRNTILQEQELQPLISEPELLSADPHACRLAFDVSSSAAMAVKYHTAVMPRFRAVRYLRRDGSCFYRAAMFALLDAARANDDVLEQLSSLCGQARAAIIERFSDYAADFCDVVIDCVDQIKQNIIRSSMDLHRYVTSPDNSEYIVFFARYAVSCHLMKNEDELFPFVVAGYDAYNSMDEFCKSEVEVVGQDCDHLHLVAFSRTFLVSLSVEYLDATPGDAVAHVVTPENVTSPITSISLLYRPGHYDLLIPL